MRIVAKIISVVFHPLLMPAFGIYLLFNLPTVPVSFMKLDALYFYPDEVKRPFLIVLAVLTFIAPGISMLIMKSTKMISSFELDERSERAAPFVIVIFYAVLAFVYLRYQIPEYLQHPALLAFAFGISISLFLAFVINASGVKISLHALAMFGVTGGILAYNQTQLPITAEEGFANLSFIIMLTVVSGLVCSFRMFLGAHSLKEILAGFAVGFIVMFCCVRFGLYL